MREKDWFFEKKIWVFLQTAKSSQFDAESNRFCRISQNVQELVFFWKKIDWVFEKILDFFKIARSSKVTIQGHWKSTNSQNFRKFGVFFKKKWVFPKKNLVFQKNDKGSKFAVECDCLVIFPNTLQKKRFRKQHWLFGKILEFRWKPPRAANLMQNANDIVSFL